MKGIWALLAGLTLIGSGLALAWGAEVAGPVVVMLTIAGLGWAYRRGL